MFSHILKWAFKVGEKELHLLLEGDTPLDAVKEVAYQMIKHCANVEDQQKAAQAEEDAKKQKVEDEGKEQAQAESPQAPQE